jgi:hypothetical protein
MTVDWRGRSEAEWRRGSDSDWEGFAVVSMQKWSQSGGVHTWVGGSLLLDDLAIEA